MQVVTHRSIETKFRGLDGRSHEARYLKQKRAELLEIAGGNPSLSTRILIDHAARLQLAAYLLDKRVFVDGEVLSVTDMSRRNGLQEKINATIRGIERQGKERAAAARKPLAERFGEAA